MKKTICILSFFAVVILAAAAWQYYRLCVCNFVCEDDHPRLLYVYPGASADSVFAAIGTTHRILSPFSLRLHSRLLHFNTPKTGCYLINPKEGDLALLRRLRNGEQTPVNLTFNNIRTRAQLAARLSEQLLLDSAAVISRLEDNAYMAQFGLNKETAVCLFLPNTYQVYWTISPDALFERMNKQYNSFWTPERDKKAQDLGLSRQDVATLASIVEEESNKEFEYPLIAGLYLRRLSLNMPLQACPTVKFAMQNFTLRRVLHIHTQTDSPYNTYRYKGLPPGPIRIPRQSTLDAVLASVPGEYLFMCASAELNGTHHFSKTYAEHTAYANQYHNRLNTLGIK